MLKEGHDPFSDFVVAEEFPGRTRILGSDEIRFPQDAQGPGRNVFQVSDGRTDYVKRHGRNSTDRQAERQDIP